MKTVRDKQANSKKDCKTSEVMGKINVCVMNNQNKTKRSLYGGRYNFKRD